MLTGEVKWNERPVGPRLHDRHVAKLAALAQSGQSWARTALDDSALRVYVSASGFT